MREWINIVEATVEPSVTHDEPTSDDVQHAMIATFDDDAYIRFWKTRKNVLVIQSMHASDAVRGRDMLAWLKAKYGLPIVAVEVTWEAAGFWDKMQTEGLIRRWYEITATGRPSPLGRQSVPLSEAASRVSLPKDGARSFGLSLTRLYGYDKEDDVSNYDYLDDAAGKAVRYRYIVGPTYHQFLHDMMPEINAAGWHLTADEKRRRNMWQVVFEPTLAPKTPRAGIFWHLTPRQNVETILRQGLQPKLSRHGLNYPQPRIYMIRNERDAHIMADSFANRDKRPMEYAVLRVDLRRAKGIDLRLDPELMKVAVYTTQPIPPQYLSLAHDVVPSPR